MNWNGARPLFRPRGIMDSQEVTRLSVLRLTCEGHHRSNWSLGTLIKWEWGSYFLWWNSPCRDDSTVIGWGDLEESSLHEHFFLSFFFFFSTFFYFNLLLKISELNLKMGLNFTVWIITQIVIILCRIKDRNVTN